MVGSQLRRESPSGNSPLSTRYTVLYFVTTPSYKKTILGSKQPVSGINFVFRFSPRLSKVYKTRPDTCNNTLCSVLKSITKILPVTFLWVWMFTFWFIGCIPILMSRSRLDFCEIETNFISFNQSWSSTSKRTYSASLKQNLSLWEMNKPEIHWCAREDLKFRSWTPRSISIISMIQDCHNLWSATSRLSTT